MRPVLLLLSTLLVVPLAAAATCVPTCDVQAALPGFASPVTLVESGASVRWTAVDVAHTATADSGCFGVTTSPGSSAVTFSVSGGAVVATNAAGVAKTCAATALPDGGYLVRYHCAFHAAMKAALVVK